MVFGFLVFGSLKKRSAKSSFICKQCVQLGKRLLLYIIIQNINNWVISNILRCWTGEHSITHPSSWRCSKNQPQKIFFFCIGQDQYKKKIIRISNYSDLFVYGAFIFRFRVSTFLTIQMSTFLTIVPLIILSMYRPIVWMRFFTKITK